MGYNPYRRSRARGVADYLFVAAALVVCALLVAWALFGVSAQPSAEPGHTVRRVHPYEATKTYQCPGCTHDIAPGMGHVVAIPDEAPDLRRHWHHGCWQARHRRRPGR